MGGPLNTEASYPFTPTPRSGHLSPLAVPEVHPSLISQPSNKHHLPRSSGSCSGTLTKAGDGVEETL